MQFFSGECIWRHYGIAVSANFSSLPASLSCIVRDQLSCAVLMTMHMSSMWPSGDTQFDMPGVHAFTRMQIDMYLALISKTHEK